ncbi:cupin domain-containing protein [Kribbella sp. CA-253562]|uniref:cupin domain-containing protein n=1 Tax=Kribbella sp. CA-253562 TaxID=3239942 RepID=UPI003D918C63
MGVVDGTELRASAGGGEEGEIAAGAGKSQFSPMWIAAAGDLPAAPVTNAVAHQWPSAAILQEIESAAVLVPEGRPERRIVGLANPGVRGPGVATTDTLFAAVQIIHPGEQVPPHRHSMSSIRFGIEGEGVVTLVNGTPVPMRPRDLLVQHAGEWHEHRNEGSVRCVWLDGLDLPMVSRLAAVWFELPDGPFETTQEHPRPALYRWEEVQARLEGTAAVDGVRRVPYGSDGRVTGTLGCEVIAIDAARATGRWREACSSVVMVVEGSGVSEVAGKTIGWAQGDVLAVPAWSWQQHWAGDAAILFRLSDRPALVALELFREEYADS